MEELKQIKKQIKSSLAFIQSLNQYNNDDITKGIILGYKHILDMIKELQATNYQDQCPKNISTYAESIAKAYGDEASVTIAAYTLAANHDIIDSGSLMKYLKAIKQAVDKDR